MRIVIGLVLLGVVLAGCSSTQPVRARIAVLEALQGDAQGYAQALAPRTFQFPQDHGPHPAYRTEWWYYTGTLEDAEGRQFGFQLTFFRTALTPAPVERASEWAASQVYMAHFAVTDVQGRRFAAFDRFGRGAAGIAGAQAQPFQVWLEDWRVEQDGALDQHGVPPMRLRAAQDGMAIDLVAQSLRPPVLHGQAGLSQKGTTPGNASYYYSLSRMETRGSITVAGEPFRVTGLSWMDREWSTSILEEGVAGWDWFGLHLDDGRDLMVGQLRRGDGGRAYAFGSLVEADSRTQMLVADDIQLDVLGEWRSPRTGVVYPSGWRLRVPAYALDLEVHPLLPDQELNLATLYWEGAVRITGSAGGAGYAELTGYGEQGDAGRSGRADGLRDVFDRVMPGSRSARGAGAGSGRTGGWRA